ncbi:fungal-specific transcription factor domain-containing protein [Xylariaceae sp. FL1272]|nr:fungal-specific transcription factor domain-containing protein [Xylariaceae sp. FL1272]
MDNEMPHANADEEPPQKRQRVLACRRCRHRKQKCTDDRPCVNCKKSGEECIPTEPAPRPSSVESTYVKALEGRIAELEALDPSQSNDHLPMSRTMDHSGPPAASPATTTSDSHQVGNVPVFTEPVFSHDAHATSPVSVSRIRRRSAHHRIANISAMQRLGTASLLDNALESAAGMVAHDSHMSPAHSENSSASHMRHLRDSSAPVQNLSREMDELLLGAYRDRTHAIYPFLHWGTLLCWCAEWKSISTPSDPSRRWQGFFVNMLYSTAVLLLSEAPAEKVDGTEFFKTGATYLQDVFEQPNPRLHAQAYLLLCMHALHNSSTHRIISLVSTAMRYCVQNLFHLSSAEPETTDTHGRIEIQMRRRCFWSAYTLDRMISAAFDVPPSVPDAMITAKLYANVSDESLEFAASQVTDGVDIPGFLVYTSMSPSLHILQVRRIQSEISLHTLQWNYSLVYEKLFDWRSRILLELENYKSRIQAFADPESKSHTSHRWLAMIYHYTLLMLYRPTKENVSGPAGDWSVQASSQACLTFRAFQRDRAVAQTWLALIHQFQAGVALLYCFWATPPEYRTENYDSDDVPDAVRACSNILAIMADRWPKADCLRDVFEHLAREVPLVDRPNRPPTRLSNKIEMAVREKLPEVRNMVVHNSTLRMIEEMISEDFPRLARDGVENRSVPSSHLTTNKQSNIDTGRTFEQDLDTPIFDMPFSNQDTYRLDGTNDGVSHITVDDMPAFPGVFDAL